MPYKALLLTLLRLLCKASILPLCGFLSLPLHANSIGEMDRFFSQVHTLQARFTQVVFDENLIPLEESSGQLRISRPGRFRWDYDPPAEQVIVADGTRLWFYDLELEQVTVRRMADALGESPAAVLSGSGNPKENYQATDLGVQGDISWVSLVPRKSSETFAQIQLGFEGPTLRLIQLLDELGQITRIVLADVKENGNFEPSTFKFQIPSGVDILDESG